MARTFREYMLTISPPWLQTAHGAPFVQGIGIMKDSLLFRAREAARARFPTLASNDAVNLLGTERGIFRAPGETTASYAGRVVEAWDTWAYAGTAFGILSALRGAGYDNVKLAQFNQRLYELDVDGVLVTTVLPDGSWMFQDTADTYWARGIVIFPEPLLARWVSDGVPGSSSDEANLIRSIVRKWKPPWMLIDSIIIATCAWTWGYRTEGATWGAQDRTTWGEESTAWTTWSP